MSSSAGDSMNKLVWSSDREEVLCFQGCHGGEGGREGRQRSSLGSSSSPTETMDGLWLPLLRLMPAIAVKSSDRMAVFLLPPGQEPDGRHCSFILEFMVWCHGGLATPSGAVPDEDESSFGLEMRGTRLLSSSIFCGPLCNSQGPVSVLPFRSGSCCKIVVYYFFLVNAAPGSIWTLVCSGFLIRVVRDTT